MKPLFIWAGGKTKVLKHYKDFLPSSSSFSNYYEPFFGGGAMFVHVEGRRLTGGAHGNNGVGPVFNMKIYQALECRHVDGAIAVHRRDQGNHTSVKHCKKIRTREMKHRMVLGPLTPDKLWPQTANENRNID